MAALVTTLEQLDLAWIALQQQWQATQDQWRDTTRDYFAQRFWGEYERLVPPAEGAMQRLDEMIRQALRKVR